MKGRRRETTGTLLSLETLRDIAVTGDTAVTRDTIVIGGIVYNINYIIIESVDSISRDGTDTPYI